MRAVDNTRGVGKFIWYWTEKGIVQRQRGTGKVLERFERRKQPAAPSRASRPGG